jgi:hypothetical protein
MDGILREIVESDFDRIRRLYKGHCEVPAILPKFLKAIKPPISINKSFRAMD